MKYSVSMPATEWERRACHGAKNGIQAMRMHWRLFTTMTNWSTLSIVVVASCRLGGAGLVLRGFKLLFRVLVLVKGLQHFGRFTRT